MSEAELYRWMAGRFVGEWTRIENAVGSGIPDVCVLYNRQTFWIELKLGSFPLLRPAQRVWHLRAAVQGVVVRVVLLHPNNSLLSIYADSPRHYEFDGKYWKITSKPTLVVTRDIRNAQSIHDALFSSSP